MKITKVTLNNFEAFKSECTIDLPKGKNLLLYGENGSGKSSLFHALNLCLAPATAIGEYKNIFVSTDDSSVKLEVDDGSKLEWDETSHPYTQPVIVEASKTKGFLDYRALLETHFVHRQKHSVNIFDLLVKNLLANIQNPITSRLFGDEWAIIEQKLPERKSAFHTEYVSDLVSSFSAGLSGVLEDLADKSNGILDSFEQNVVINLSLPTEGMSFDADFKLVHNHDVVLTASYYGHDIPRHHLFLNEARLSAIAISIYLGALLLNPPSQLRVLFLDDVLIGLDMSNRLPLLDILEKHFSDWQVILATFDKVWFDMAWQRVKDLKTWEQGELRCARDNECDVPVYKGDTEYLNVARSHLDAGDLRAAAIYIRAAYERELKRFCDKFHLPVRYCENTKDQKAEDFWRVVKAQKRKGGSDLLTPQVITNVQSFRSTIVNQLSHTAPVNLVRSEVEKAYTSIDTLRDTLKPVKKSDLQ
ncbi:MAG: AAA family ATPase [Dehalococcoidia bacterium]|nr:AAA family ATPase [Dehalococcoidia bacterium]